MKIQGSKRQVKIAHGQSVKLSQNYQTMEAHYSIEVIVGDDPESIREGIARAEQLVEKNLARKMKQQREVLNELSGQ